jgi:DNA-directed RNA polymerase II subunit RPB2
MVDDAFHSQSAGPVTAMTHQAFQGRARGGGFWLYEMDRDCIFIAWCSGVLEAAIETRVTLARSMFVVYAGREQLSTSPSTVELQCCNSNNKTHISQLYIPYSCKLVLQNISWQRLCALTLRC